MKEKRASSGYDVILRRLLFLCCGVLTGFLIPPLLNIDHHYSDTAADSSSSIVNDEDVNGVAMSNAIVDGEWGRPAAQLRNVDTSQALNVTQAIISLWPRIVVLRCETKKKERECV